MKIANHPQAVVVLFSQLLVRAYAKHSHPQNLVHPTVVIISSHVCSNNLTTIIILGQVSTLASQYCGIISASSGGQSLGLGIGLLGSQ
jgi:hypothetical protein